MISSSKLQEILDTANWLPERFQFTVEQKKEIMDIYDVLESEEEQVKYLEYFYSYLSKSCEGIQVASRLSLRDEISEIEKLEKPIELESNLF